MPNVRELPAGETALAGRALLELRPQFGDAPTIVARVDDVQRAEGYRVLASFADDDAAEAMAVAGFRVLESLHSGRGLYVDELVTLPEARGRGHAGALFAWLEEEAERLGCDTLSLDSGVGPERADAHRFYFRHRLRIVSYHFSRAVRRG